MRGLTRHAKALLVAYGVFLFLALLSPASSLQSESVSLLGRLLGHLGVPASLTVQPRLEFIMNAVIVAPVPFLGYLLFPRYSWRDWTAMGFVGALMVEVLQALLLPERNASYADVVANTLGALLGAGLAELSRSSAHDPGPVRARVRRALIITYVGYLIAVGVLVLDPSQQAPGVTLSLVSRALQLLQLPVVADSRTLETLSNVALFVPLSLLGMFIWPSHRILTWTLAGALLSATIELFQLVLLPDRFATVSDVVANTAGAFLGAVLATIIARSSVGRGSQVVRPEVRLPD